MFEQLIKVKTYYLKVFTVFQLLTPIYFINCISFNSFHKTPNFKVTEKAVKYECGEYFMSL